MPAITPVAVVVVVVVVVVVAVLALVAVITTSAYFKAQQLMGGRWGLSSLSCCALYKKF